MITSARNLAEDATLEADVAVVGSGPAGIVLALELEAAQLEVILVESGETAFRRAVQELAEAADWDRTRHAAMSLAVRRQVGGTSTIWGGRCVPYDPIDFERPSSSAGMRWPVSYGELQPYFPRACAWMACGRAVFDARQSGHLPPSIVPGLPNDFVSTASLERWSLPTDFGRVYGDRLRRSHRVRLLTGLTCIGIHSRRGEERVSHLDCRSLDGGRVSVRARAYVVAAGGLESTRLLLCSPGRDGRPIGDHSGHLGRWYMGHVEGTIASVRFAGDPRRVIYGYEKDVDGSYVRRRFSFTTRYLREHGLPNIVGWLANPNPSDASHRSGPLSFAYLALVSPLGRRLAPEAQRLTLTGQPPPGAPYAPTQPSPRRAHWENMIRQPGQTMAFVAGFGSRRFLARGRRAPGFFVYRPDGTYPLQYHGEQEPARSSQVSLAQSLDAVGLRRLKIDIRYTQADVDGVLGAHRAWDGYLRATGQGCLVYRTDPREAVWERLGGGFHQVGTTRMSDRPEDGVVDPRLAVHGFPDLFVASSSTFVTAGQANSTFMVVVFALRLADHLRSALATRSA